jgi:class 3 adenylate cyclase/tetratricopeptide (TPR) repeat protein
MTTCPACGQETPEGFPRCAHCGAPLAAPEQAREERKVVTVLFADLVGFTARSERLDPEEVRALQAPYWQHVRAELERFGGTVEKFIGDAVMALFGAPTAHEDDPERAVRAALAIRDWARDQGDLEVRIGITTGETLVSLGARPEAGEGMASGDVVNTASRLQAAAPPNGVLVDETTYRASEQVIDYRQAESAAAKGKAEPVPVWEAVEARSLVGVELRPATPLVGRERERDLLLGALDRVRRESSPQLVTLVGVPGIGKSRLVAELFAEVERDPELIHWRQGRSLPYGEGVSFWALAEMVKAQAGILASDSNGTAAEKLREAVAAVVDDADAGWVESRLRPLVGLGEGADEREESFAAWTRFVEALADQRATVFVFEDLQWADGDLLDFVDHLADWAAGVPLLLVGTARPELLDRRPGWGGGKRNALTISLAPLDDVETAQLLATLLERPVLPAETQTRLLARAGGNPLYAEQFARMLAERGDGGELPEAVQGIIAARLDALSLEEKALLQDASVVGRAFWTGALEAVAGVTVRDAQQRLHALERKEFVRRERRSAVAGETEHAFAHLLVRDVAYGQIPRAQRAEKHLRVAEWIESLGRAEDRAELLAHHYLAAVELAGAAGIDVGPIRERARDACLEAGERATSLNSFAAARRFYTWALELSPPDDPKRPYVVLAAARDMQYEAPREKRELLTDAIDAFLATDDREAAAEARMLFAGYLWNDGDSARAEEEIREAVELLAAEPPSPVKAAVLAQRSRYAMLGRNTSEAIRIAREGLELAEQLSLDALRAALLNTIGTSRAQSGDPGGLADLGRALAIAREIVHPGEIHRAYNNLVEMHREAGNWPEASRLLAELRAMDERFGLVYSLRWVEGEEAMDRYPRGDWDGAIAAADAVISYVEAGISNYMEPICRANRARIRLARGDEPEALEDSGRAVDHGRHSDPQVVGPVLAAHASVLLAVEDREQAGEVASEALRVPAYHYGAFDLAFVLHDLGRAGELERWLDGLGSCPAADAGRAIARGDFHQAAEILAPTGNLADEAYARLRCGTEEDVRRALEFYRSVGATRYVREGEAGLATSRSA